MTTTASRYRTDRLELGESPVLGIIEIDEQQDVLSLEAFNESANQAKSNATLETENSSHQPVTSRRVMADVAVIKSQLLTELQTIRANIRRQRQSW